MGCDYYEILIDDVAIASRVTLEWTLPIVKAVFEHLYNETDLAVTVRKMDEEQREGAGSKRYCPNCGAEMEANNG